MLMVALAVYDKLTPGELTGGRSIAGAGTLDEVGGVGPVDGIRQRMVAARTEGAEYFLAAAANCPEAQDRRPEGMTVAKVETFDDARQVVESIAPGRHRLVAALLSRMRPRGCSGPVTTCARPTDRARRSETSRSLLW